MQRQKNHKIVEGSVEELPRIATELARKKHQKTCKKGKCDRKTEQDTERGMKEDIVLKKKAAGTTTIRVCNLNEWTCHEGIGPMEIID